MCDLRLYMACDSRTTPLTSLQESLGGAYRRRGAHEQIRGRPDSDQEQVRRRSGCIGFWNWWAFFGPGWGDLKCVYLLLKHFFGGISTEDGLGKGYYDCLRDI